jgi:hypothetical protein
MKGVTLFVRYGQKRLAFAPQPLYHVSFERTPTYDAPALSYKPAASEVCATIDMLLSGAQVVLGIDFSSMTWEMNKTFE